MPVNRQTVRELSRTTLYNITSSGQAWRAFLDAAARLYKYSFPEQVLIYAQEPEATACAAKEVWYTRMKRSLRPDAQAIALPDPHSHFGRLKYVFDVRETQPLPGAPEFRQWRLPFEACDGQAGTGIWNFPGTRGGGPRLRACDERAAGAVSDAADGDAACGGRRRPVVRAGRRRAGPAVPPARGGQRGIHGGRPCWHWNGCGHVGRAGKHHALQQLRTGRTRGHLCQPSGRVGAAGC